MATHYGHARSQASDHPGIRWFDPRDERMMIQFDGDGAESRDGRPVRFASIKPYQPAEFGEPAERYCARISYIDEVVHGNERRAMAAEVFGGGTDAALEAAREYLAAEVSAFEAADRRDARAARDAGD